MGKSMLEWLKVNHTKEASRNLSPFMGDFFFFQHLSQLIFDLAKQGVYFKVPNLKIMKAL